ncbi:MAG: hypothetical protein J0H49_28955 [Acidobacteria bacterium]|nr:hypothetical protein [Acidobacteriota bacterium]
MGLYVHSLGEIPTDTERAYYVYLLDYGWEEPLGDAVRANLPRMADLASRSDAVVIHGPRGVHFEDEVLSWHRINGQDAGDILPALLVTTRHPSTFRESFSLIRTEPENRDPLLLVPLRKICTSAQEVADLIHMVFEDIKGKKRLPDFHAAKRMQRGVGRALVDAVILQPKLGGVGFDLKNFFSGFKK